MGHCFRIAGGPRLGCFICLVCLPPPTSFKREVSTCIWSISTQKHIYLAPQPFPSDCEPPVGRRICIYVDDISDCPFIFCHHKYNLSGEY